MAQAKKGDPIAFRLWKILDEQDLITLKKISTFLDKNQYEEALKEAEGLYKNDHDQDDENNPFLVERTELKDAVVNIILWRKYSNDAASKNISFNDISRFVEDNRFYPNMASLRKKAQKVVIDNKIPYNLSEQYFKTNPADNLDSKLYLIGAKSEFLLRFKGSEEQKNKIAQEIQNAIISVWINEDFDANKEREFLNKYGDKLIESDHINRINRLLWDGKFTDAKRIMNFVNENYQKLFLAIIEIKSFPKYIDNILLTVPRELRLDENLTYSRILWHKSKDEIDELVDLFVRVSEVKYPQRWWSLRRFYTREMLKRKEYKIAYILAKNHNLSTKAADYWEAEWMAGWISLRFLNHPKEAYIHFDNLYKNVTQPVTISRGAYWLGMAANAMGDKAKAIEWYKVAASYPVYFYGQLAIHKYRALDSVNAHDDIVLPKDPDIKVGDARKISISMAAKVGYLLALMGEKSDATKVLENVIATADSDGQIAVIMRLAGEMQDMQMDVKLSRAAARKNVFFIRDKFKIVKEVGNDEYAPLIHAIVKQESGFAPSALSNVGAVGFMQIMPETAKLVAKDVGVKYDRKKLATDINYNVKLGSHYIKQMIDRFEGSEMLAIASYNAGPNATARWIKEFYDPRDEKDLDKVVDWIELITYSETRNYVQRIMENLIVYKYLMSRSNYDEVK